MQCPFHSPTHFCTKQWNKCSAEQYYAQRQAQLLSRVAGRMSSAHTNRFEIASASLGYSVCARLLLEQSPCVCLFAIQYGIYCTDHSVLIVHLLRTTCEI